MASCHGSHRWCVQTGHPTLRARRRGQAGEPYALRVLHALVRAPRAGPRQPGHRGWSPGQDGSITGSHPREHSALADPCARTRCPYRAAGRQAAMGRAGPSSRYARPQDAPARVAGRPEHARKGGLTWHEQAIPSP
uniref:Uncharacterized protein n=1 Tax=uncultured marine virus TaxID=186617 RepID=A0A0F7L5L2_9VIRU|nr:hypothetical protein [uncultured marine virus]